MFEGIYSAFIRSLCIFVDMNCLLYDYSLSQTIPWTQLSQTTPWAQLNRTTPWAQLSQTTPWTQLSQTTHWAQLSQTTPWAQLSRTTPWTQLSQTTSWTKWSDIRSQERMLTVNCFVLFCCWIMLHLLKVFWVCYVSEITWYFQWYINCYGILHL